MSNPFKKARMDQLYKMYVTGRSANSLQEEQPAPPEPNTPQRPRDGAMIRGFEDYAEEYEIHLQNEIHRPAQQRQPYPFFTPPRPASQLLERGGSVDVDHIVREARVDTVDLDMTSAIIICKALRGMDILRVSEELEIGLVEIAGIREKLLRELER